MLDRFTQLDEFWQAFQNLTGWQIDVANRAAILSLLIAVFIALLVYALVHRIWIVSGKAAVRQVSEEQEIEQLRLRQRN